MKKCDFCRKREAIIKLPFNPGFFCKDCFTTFLEKKILKNIRKGKLLKASVIKVYEEDRIEKKVLIHILKKYFSKSNKLIFVDSKSKENISAITVEEGAIKFLESMLKDKELFFPPERNLLDDVSIFELEEYAKIENIPFKEPDFGQIYQKLKEIYLKRPSIFFSTYQSAKKIQKRIGRQQSNQKQDC